MTNTQHKMTPPVRRGLQSQIIHTPLAHIIDPTHIHTPCYDELLVKVTVSSFLLNDLRSLLKCGASSLAVKRQVVTNISSEK